MAMQGYRCVNTVTKEEKDYTNLHTAWDALGGTKPKFSLQHYWHLREAFEWVGEDGVLYNLTPNIVVKSAETRGAKVDTFLVYDILTTEVETCIGSEKVRKFCDATHSRVAACLKKINPSPINGRYIVQRESTAIEWDEVYGLKAQRWRIVYEHFKDRFPEPKARVPRPDASLVIKQLMEIEETEGFGELTMYKTNHKSKGSFKKPLVEDDKVKEVLSVEPKVDDSPKPEPVKMSTPEPINVPPPVTRNSTGMNGRYRVR